MLVDTDVCKKLLNTKDDLRAQDLSTYGVDVYEVTVSVKSKLFYFFEIYLHINC